MADDKQGRDAQAHDAENEQIRREVAEALERRDEPEPPIADEDLDEVEAALAAVSFPATAAEVVAAAGDREVHAPDGTHAVGALVPDANVESFESADAVSERVARPSVAATLKRVLEAAAAHPEASVGTSQRDAYEATLRAVAAIDATDDDAIVGEIGEWILEHLERKGALPGSRAVRREAAKRCRAAGTSVNADEWLGV